MARSVRVRAHFRTDQGRVRNNNQDFVAWKEPADAVEEAQDGWLYILADGAGGMDAGEVASQYATERTLHHYLDGQETADWSDRLYGAMQTANTELRELSARKDKNSRMATTMVATVIHDNQAHVANVGDSRAYLWREGDLRQVTKDQSLVAKLLDEGAITAEEAAKHPRKNVILYSLGSEREPQIDLYDLALQPDDRLLVCSDGLTRHVSDEEIGLVLGQEGPAEATETLVNLANERGGEDNVSVGVLHFQPPPPAAEERSPKVVPVSDAESRRAPETSGGLWLFTAFLSLVQTLLIVLIWVFLHF
ncbi:MAG: Stp1/IreP family PP2C-type Ser/Thr phosphatase [Candidatus Promineifilaceae bacterium]|nr:Stp1/IreP family PP2C-type Ser/Thr phosphatase [Candidatus Promineifilaceae bacterium]